MTERASLAAAVARLSVAFESESSFCQPFVDVFPVARAAISMLGDPFGVETVCASDEEAGRLDELQIDLGEGPCWDALAARQPVVEPDIQIRPNGSWPVWSEAIREAGLRAVYAFPLTVGALKIGAIDLYSDTVDSMSSTDLSHASTLSAVAATQVLRLAMSRHPGGEDVAPDDSRYSRRGVHQATGMVIAQLQVTPEDALLIIRAHAFATARTVREVAAEITSLRLDFSR